MSVGLVLYRFSVTGRSWTVAFAFGSFATGLLITITLELAAWPREILRIRKQLSTIGEVTALNPILAAAYRELMAEFHGKVAQFTHGQYTDTRPAVPDLSIATVAGLTQSGYATYIADRRQGIYQDPQGHRYMDQWYETAKAGVATLKRLFILDDLRTCSPDLLALMQLQVDNGIAVFVISRDEATGIAEGKSLDFGLFDSVCVMIVSRASEEAPVKLSVFVELADQTNATLVRDYTDTWRRLVANAVEFSDFFRQYVAPPNADYWNRWHLTEATRIAPPLGLSDKDAHLIVERVANSTDGHELNIAVLGLTVALREMLELEARVQTVTLLDQSTVETPYVGAKESRTTENWLVHRPASQYDAIVGDEALNNLRLAQYGMFFRAIAANVKTDGLLAMRVFGRFGDFERYIHMTVDELVHEVLLDESLSPATRKYLAMHNVAVSFNEATTEVDNLTFNALIAKTCAGGLLTPAQAEQLYFPSQSPMPVLLTSPTLEHIARASSQFFSLLPLTQIDDDYCPEPLFHDFYKILTFRRNRTEVPD